MNVNTAYGEARRKRAEDRLKLKLIYNEGLLNLANEEVEECLEICNKANNGELDYSINAGVMKLGSAVRNRDQIIEEMKSIKSELGLEEEEYI